MHCIMIEHTRVAITPKNKLEGVMYSKIFPSRVISIGAVQVFSLLLFSMSNS